MIAFSLLKSKATPVAERILQWAEREMFPDFGNNDGQDPDLVQDAISKMTKTNAPWAGVDIAYDGHALYTEPKMKRLWATQRQIAKIYDITVSSVSRHLTAIYEDGILDPYATIAFRSTLFNEGNQTVTRQIILYNFEAISAVGDLVSSDKAKAFRAWRAKVVEDHLLLVTEKNESLATSVALMKMSAPPVINRNAIIQAETDDLILESRLAANLHPLTGQPLKTRQERKEAIIAMKTHQRKIHNALLVATGVVAQDWDPDDEPITVDTVIRKCPGLMERDTTVWPIWPLVAGNVEPNTSDVSQADSQMAAPKGTNIANDDPDKELRAARKLASEIACMDACVADHVRNQMVLTRPEFSNFKEITIAGWDTGLVTVDADRCADPERYEVGAEMARLAIDAGVAKGKRYVVATNVDEILADWTAWISEDAIRKASVIAVVHPDPKLRAAWAARLAQALKDDGETQH